MLRRGLNRPEKEKKERVEVRVGGVLEHDSDTNTEAWGVLERYLEIRILDEHVFIVYLLLKSRDEQSNVRPHNLPCYSMDLVNCCLVLDRHPCSDCSNILVIRKHRRGNRCHWILEPDK